MDLNIAMQVARLLLPALVGIGFTALLALSLKVAVMPRRNPISGRFPQLSS